MATSLKNRNFLKLLDYTPAEIQYLIDLAINRRQEIWKRKTNAGR